VAGFGELSHLAGWFAFAGKYISGLQRGSSRACSYAPASGFNSPDLAPEKTLSSAHLNLTLHFLRLPETTEPAALAANVATLQAFPAKTDGPLFGDKYENEIEISDGLLSSVPEFRVAKSDEPRAHYSTTSHDLYGGAWNDHIRADSGPAFRGNSLCSSIQNR
jgi:hypothetical protein